MTAELLLLVQAAKEYLRSMKESKKSKGRRQPLSKLPRHHPLLVKDCISDDGKGASCSLGGCGEGLSFYGQCRVFHCVTGDKQESAVLIYFLCVCMCLHH